MSRVPLNRKPVLKRKMIFSFVFSVLVPILLFSAILFANVNSNVIRNQIAERKDALLVEQNYMNNQLQSALTYCNQLTSNYDFMSIVNGYSYSKREIVYAYQKQVYSLLNEIIVLDENLESIRVFTDNKNAVAILPMFFSMNDFFMNEKFDAETVPSDLVTGYWRIKEDNHNLRLIFTKQIFNPTTASVKGYIEMIYNDNILENYISGSSGNDTSITTYLIYKGDVIGLHNFGSTLPNQELKFLDQVPLDSSTPVLQTINSDRIFVTTIYPDIPDFRIIKVSEIGWSRIPLQPITLIFTLSIGTIILSSIVIRRLVYHPFLNILRLSDHMNSNTTHHLKPYNGTVSNDETGDLIRTYNDMSHRINTLSDNLLNSEMQLKNAQIEALHSQLNPHFFYGTLETIRMIAETNKQELISDIAYSFGNLMRYSLSREYLVDIHKEVDISKQYMTIQDKRLNNRFSITWNTDLSDECKCPKFILFSLLENVFSHNVSKTREFIRIEASVIVLNDTLHIAVTNSGPGITKKRIDELRYLLGHSSARGSMTSDENGRSIFNINDRLKLFYGENYRFTLESKAGVTTTIEIYLPKKPHIFE